MKGKLIKNSLLPTVLISLIPTISALNFNNPDYISYKANYENEWMWFEPLFEGFAYLFRSVGASYNQFYIFFMLIISSLIFRIYKNSIALSGINLIFMGLMYGATQYRFFLASLIFILAYTSRKRLNKYVLCIVAAGFHYVLIFPSVLLILCSLFKNRKLFYSSYSAIFIFILIFVKMNQQFLLTLFGKEYYLNSIFYSGRSIEGLIYTVVSLLLLSFIVIQKLIKKLDITNEIIPLGIMLTSLTFAEFSVFSGRLTKIYFLMEPIILFNLQGVFLKKTSSSYYTFIGLAAIYMSIKFI